MKNRPKVKTVSVTMRAAPADRDHMAHLAKRFGCSRGEAALKAVRYTIAAIEKIEKERRHLV